MKAVSEKRAYEELANAIVIQAVADYRDALTQLLDDCIDEKDRKDAQHTVQECEQFFRSDYFSLLTNVGGEFLIKSIKEEVENGEVPEKV